MKTLWAPWRLEYVTDDSPDRKTGCVFCPRLAGREDEQNLILYRTPLTAVIMNRYPYSNGHLLVMPNQHTGEMDNLSQAELLDLCESTRLSLRALKQTMKPHAFNVGLNLGKGEVAGAGIPDHLHVHVVPRWEGDTSFMPVLADVKVMPELLTQSYHKLKQAFDQLVAKKK